MIASFSALEIAAMVTSATAAGLLGFSWMRQADQHARRRRVVEKTLEASLVADRRIASKDFMHVLVKQSQRLEYTSYPQEREKRLGGMVKEWWLKQPVPLAFKRSITPLAILRTARVCGGVGALIGYAVGCLFSGELAGIGCVLGACIGGSAPFRAIKHSARTHQVQLEAQLPEMLEVVALGMRSGLSFDRSLELYADHFDGVLAQDCASAQRMWTMGLLTREEALRDLAASYKSASFEHIVEGIIRALKFGSSMSEILEEAAAQARATYRSDIEERVAKAPVKMMIPTGVLILPAMLLLVVGPVLLELMQGF